MTAQPNRRPDLSPLGDLERMQDARPLKYRWWFAPAHEPVPSPKAARKFYLLHEALVIQCPKDGCKHGPKRHSQSEPGIWVVTAADVKVMSDWWPRLIRRLEEHEAWHRAERWKERRRWAAEGMYLEKGVDETTPGKIDEARQNMKLVKHNRMRKANGG